MKKKIAHIFVFILVLCTTSLAGSESILKTTTAMGRCTVKVNIELENGTTVEGTVTIESDNMNMFKCAGIKLYGLLSDKY